VTLVMGRSRQFGVNILVTVYYEERLSAERTDIIEQAIGIGQVINIQENGLIQVLVVREEPSHASLWQRIRNREMPILADVVIKPSIDFNAEGIEVRIDE
jgi:ribosomal 30S subunit maturation factor RimM